ncbi:MAG TPA: hypothetical protein VLH79_09095 [Chthonomonadales bacterium]|nr:hypothetical protein [Chthonomonadales bacterium]
MPNAMRPIVEPTVQSLLADIRNGDPAVRARAVEQAPLVGARSIGALGEVYGAGDPAAAKAAAEALRRVAHHAARPGAAVERRAAVREIASLIGSRQPHPLRVDAAYLLGFIGGADAVPALAAQLADPALRDHARLALERITDRSADGALTRAQDTAAADFRPAIAQSIAVRRARARR